MPSFKVPCPSCEAKVLIKNPDLIGTKVECPKCKYRFKVEAPAGGVPADEAAGKEKDKDKKPEAAADGDGKKKKKDKKEKDKGGKKNKKPLGIVLGVAGVLVLAVGGFIMFGGDDKPSGGGGGGGGGGNYGGTRTTGGGTGTDTDTTGDGSTPAPPKKAGTPPVLRSDKDPTNLLPNKSVAVYRFDIQRLRSSTPLLGPIFDKSMTDLFVASMGFEPSLVETYFHCVVGEKERAPFGLIRLTDPIAASEVKIAGRGKERTVNGKALAPVKGNAFLTAVGNTFAYRSLAADVYDRPAAGPVAAKTGKAADVPLGACVYDSQTILVGEMGVLETYLKGLKNGYPEFQTVLKKAPPPPPKKDPMMPDTTPMPGAGTPATMPMTPMTPGMEPKKNPAAKKDEPPPNKDFTTNPSYLSVPTDLKKLLNTMEDDAPTPMLVIAEKFDTDAYPRKGVRKAYEPVAKAIDPVLNRTRYVGANLTAFDSKKLTGYIRIVGKTGDDARTIAIDELGPKLTDAVPVLALILFTDPYQIAFRNYADPNAMPPDGTMGPMGMIPGGPMGPMGPMGVPMQPPPPPRTPGQPGPMGMTPPRTGPGMPPTMTMTPGQPYDPTQPYQPVNVPSHIDLRLRDDVVTVAFDLALTDEAYRGRLSPHIAALQNQVKGKASVYAGTHGAHGLAQAVAAYVEKNKRFPRGTVPRTPEPDRRGLPYPPIQRLSFLTELLPYLGRDAISNTLNRGKAWYDEVNATPTETWVPEFLVSYYPAEAWRAYSPLMPERGFGATNYVAVAGVGVDAARLDPKNPAQARQMGISGYEWGSTVEEVTDGLANTIYLLQVPPGYARPWASGGGATVEGIDPTDPMAAFKSQRPDGQWGTHAIMGDGAVRWIPADIKPADMVALVTRAGGEKLSADLNVIAPKVDQSGKVVELKADPKAADVTPNDPKTPAAKATDPKSTPAPMSKSDAPVKAAPPSDIPAPREK